MFITLDRNYEIKCTLGTIKDIEEKFAKPFFTVMSGLEKMTTTEQIKLLYMGARKANPSLMETDFIQACEDNIGLGDLAEYLEKFVLQLQYPGLSVEEVQQKLEKKLQQAEAAKASVGMKY